MRQSRLIYYLIVGSVCLVLSDCKKFVEISPPKTQLVSTVVFSNDASAISAITGIYGTLMANQGFASLNTTYYAGMSSDEMTDYSNLAPNTQIFNNNIDPTNTNILGFWGQAYQAIYQANAIIDGLEKSSGVSQQVNQQLTAEAYFLRAFCSFYLVNLFGDIPLILTTDYQKNALSARSPITDVYDQIIADLKNAQTGLPRDFGFTNGERIRPTYWAATALLARVCLYRADWMGAELSASELINNNSLFNLSSDPDSVFLSNSYESIWQLQPVYPGFNTWEGNVFILNDNPSGTSFGVALTQILVQSFEPGDQRLTKWINSFSDPTTSQIFYYPYKYKVKTSSVLSEYYTVFRLAEQFLIRAEARANQNNPDGALADLNKIRTRAGLTPSIANDKSSLLQAIEQERRVELFAEWGHRWLDLKRTSRVTPVLSLVKPGWLPTDSLYPIPATERQNDPNLKQNPGYK